MKVKTFENFSFSIKGRDVKLAKTHEIRNISVISNLFLIFIQFYERINKLDGKRKRK